MGNVVHRRALIVALALLLSGAACSSDEPAPVTPGPPTTSAPTTMAPTTTAPPAPTTTTEVPPVTTTVLSAEVVPPEEPPAGRIDVAADFLVSAPDQIDDSFKVENVSEWLAPDRFRSVTTLSFPGFSLGDVEVIEIGDNAWTKENGKPWLPLTGEELDEAISLAADLELDEETRRTNELELYAILSTLPWDVERRQGVEVRRYDMPVDQIARTLVLLGLSTVEADAAEGTIDVFLRTIDDALVGYDIEVRGSPELIDAPVGDYAPGTEVSVSLAAFIELGDDLGIVIEEPVVPEILAPAGYLPYASVGFGFEVLFPRPWLVFDEPIDYGGYVDVVTFIDLETSSNLLVGVEDLTGFGGLTLDDYVDLTVDQYGLFLDDVEVISITDTTTADGRNARLVHYRATSVGETIEGRQLLAFVGSEAYIVTYTSTGDTAQDLDYIDTIFGATEFSGSKTAADG